LHRVARRFVWLSIDTEREQNASIVARLDTRVLPTLYVIEPSEEKAVLAWPGSLTATELATLLDETDLAPGRGDTGGTAAVALLRARRASAAGTGAEAIAAYREALAMVPPGTPTHAEVVDGLVTALAHDGQAAACIVTSSEEAPRMRPGTAVADVVRAGIGCAFALPSHSPEPRRLSELVALGEHIASDALQPILADDRSDLYDYVVQALRALGRPDDARRLARAWSAFLDQQADRAPTPGARAVFDAHRLVAYIAIGEAHRAVPMLERSERDFPGDYNPPARLASAYLEMKRYPEALAAVTRALERAYGPRKLRLWVLEADVLVAQGNRDGAKRALADALSFAKTVPLTGSYPKLRDAIATRLAAMR
jgi:tetratricopeptide (TPR) repeat protein